MKRRSTLIAHRRTGGACRRVLAIAGVAAIGVGTAFAATGVNAATPPSTVGEGFTVSPSDLNHILRQIKIAEAHVANTTPANAPCGALLGTGPDQIASPLISAGLRTVSGICNNLQQDQELFGAADQPFPRLTTPSFRPAEAPPAAFGGGPQTSYAQTGGLVFDSEPRTISNLIVDQTSANPAAVAAAGFSIRSQGGPTEIVPCDDPNVPNVPVGCVPPGETLFIPNVTTDVGLSPPFNSLFTIFGQFFDHGLDKITNGGNGSVFVPLNDDDPLIVGPDGIAGTADDPQPGDPDFVPVGARFMQLTRGTIVTGADGFRSAPNTDSPFVDQSQTYTSHPSHQVFLRQYANNSAGRPVATGELLHSADGGMATWELTKQQAADVLGIQLTDADVGNIPEVLADLYGNFIPGPNRGMPQLVTPGGLVEGDPAADGGNGLPIPANAQRIGTAFLNDIAHAAAPKPGGPDADNVAGESLDTPVPAGTYDDELLDAHFIAGDGRVNENIGLTAVHQIFHSEHDRLVDDIKNTLLNDTSGVTVLADWQAALGAPDAVNGAWNGERLFQAARFVNEMEYQHLVFEEFARKVQPLINPFEPFAFGQTDLDPAITAEFAHAVYRFGHSMLDDTLPRINRDGSHNDIELFDGFLNPPKYAEGYPNSQDAARALFMGLSDQTGNEIDEFVADTLRNRLLGLPLDLPAINMTRARSEGIPRLNGVRRQIHAATNDGALAPYTNWVDFGEALKHPESLINFVAAYGTHDSIVNATTLAGKREAARLIVDPDLLNGDVQPPDAAEFMYGTGDYANVGGVTITGVDDIDLWIGGLAEHTNLFGGLLGSTFNYVFEEQLTNLQNGDRHYYLARTPGMNLRASLEGNSFSELVMRNTGASTLKADAFATADCKFEIGNLTFPADPGSFITGAGSVNDDPASECDENRLLLQMPDGTVRYRLSNSVDPPGINGQAVYNGTDAPDRIWGGADNDTFWGGLGVDIIEGGDGADVALGGEGNDVITDNAGDDVPKGGPGNDALDGGPGLDIVMGGDGDDFTNGGSNINETFLGEGDDFAIAGTGTDAVFGDGGSDWAEGGDQPDLLIGDSSSLFFDDHNRPGHDILIGQGGDDDYDMEGGDDIGVAGPGVEKNAGASGWDWMTGLNDPQPQVMDLELPIVEVLPVNEVRDRFNEIEALSGWNLNDTLRGDDVIPSQVAAGGFIGCDALDQNGLNRITGLDPLIPPLTIPSAPIVAASATQHCLLTGNVWGEGNVLLGGIGSDLIEGRGADDIIDGDRYLNVRLSVRTTKSAPGSEIGSTDLMEHAALSGNFGANTAGMTLQQAVFSRNVDPGNIVAVREILTPTVPAADCGAATPLNCDTAAFSGALAEYIITVAPDGTVTVDHQGGIDGIDTVRNVERLQFTDQTVAAPVAAPQLDATNPAAFANQVLTTTSGARTITVTNTGIANLVISGVTLTGANANQFAVTAPGCTTLVPGANCTISVTFTPTTTGLKTANVSIAANVPGSPINVGVSGTGINAGAPTIGLPGTQAFGNQTVNTTSAARVVTINNTGTANLVISATSLTGANANQFARTTTCATVVPGGSCTVSVTFTPTTAGAKTAALSITHNAPGSPSSVPLTGTGTAATAPGAPTVGTAIAGNGQITAQWTVPANTGGSAITSYSVRVFRASNNNLLSTTNVAGGATTSRVITGLANGTAVNFDVRAINAIGTSAASARSNTVTPANVPGAPPIGNASAGAAGGAITATARWNAAAANGSAVTGYRVTALRMAGNGTTVLSTTVSAVQPAAARTLVMTLPVLGNYRFTVQAINAVGAGAQSARSNQVAGR
jgi:Ca2+-binding RTX toxin-like protein